MIRELGERGLLNQDALTANGKSIWENNSDARNDGPDVIMPFAKPFKRDTGIAVLRGNLCPGGAIIKPSAATPKLMKHKGRAVVFENIEDFHKRVDDPDLDIDENCVMVLKYCGPKGYPGMAEVGNMPLPKKLLKKGITDMVRISDARMSGTAYGTVVLHVCPEAAAGGPLALVRERRPHRARRRQAQAAPARVREGAREAPQGVEAAGGAAHARLLEALRRSREPGERGRGPRLPRGQERCLRAARQPLKFLITDYDFADVELEKRLVSDAGFEVVTAQCRTEDDVIAAAKGCAGLLVQYAPVNAKVLAARPEIRVVSRFGAGFDTVNTDDAKKFGVWVSNSPDYGVHEVSAHALAMALSLVRHLPFLDRDVRAGKWMFDSTGELRRISKLTLGILGVGRIGKRMAHISREHLRPRAGLRSVHRAG